MEGFTDLKQKRVDKVLLIIVSINKEARHASFSLINFLYMHANVVSLFLYESIFPEGKNFQLLFILKFEKF